MAKPKTKRPRRLEGSITQKKSTGKFYWIRTLGFDDRGRQVREWSQGFDEKKDAERALLQANIDGRTKKRSRLTVGPVVEMYITDVEGRRKSPTTVQRYRGLAKNIETISDKQMETLSALDVDRLYALLRREGLSETTVFHVHSLLSASAKWAKRKALIRVNPFDNLAMDTPKREPTKANALTVEDAQALLKEIGSTRYMNALILALYSGMRRGEIAGLRWSNVDLQRKVVIVTESRYEVVGEHGQKSTKSGHKREVPLAPPAVVALNAERKRQGVAKRKAGKAWNNEGFVFTNEHGMPIAPISLTYAFRHVAEKAGLTARYSLHSLRHTAATWMIAGGTDVRTVQAILGHSEAGTTLRIYSHVVAGLAEDAIARIQGRLESGKRDAG
ncbi:MAG: tyrosine-type recombinase/integrase [Candidatus Velthaea sp.]